MIKKNNFGLNLACWAVAATLIAGAAQVAQAQDVDNVRPITIIGAVRDHAQPGGAADPADDALPEMTVIVDATDAQPAPTPAPTTQQAPKPSTAQE